jgi:FkbM family methyltransferase
MSPSTTTSGDDLVSAAETERQACNKRPLSKATRDYLFWLTDGLSSADRLRLLYFWLSPRLLGHHPGAPTPVRTRFLAGRPVYLRSRSTDARVLRDLFVRGDYALPLDVTGEISTIVDLGGYTGLTTLYFLDRYPKARVVAVEPDPTNCACLRRNIENTASAHSVKVIQACIANKGGTVRFRTEGPSWGRSITSENGIEVPCLTITELLQIHGLEKVDLLKMDIEGAEGLAFESSPQWLDRIGWILMELHPHAMTPSQLIRAVAASGRRLFLRVPVGWIDVTDQSSRASTVDGIGMDFAIPPPDISERFRGGTIAAG